MSDKKYIARPGQKVTIEINRKVRSPKSQVPSSKGLIRLRREGDYLARRQILKTLRIFDCGRNASGADISSFLIQPTLPHDPSILNMLVDPVPLEYYAARDEFLFALDGETLFDKFHEITKETDAELFRLKFESDAGTEILYESSDLWTDKGVKLPSSVVNGANFVFSVHEPGSDEFRLNLFNGLAFESLKATTAYDYSAEGVEGFLIKAGDALFLMPSLCLYAGQSDYFFGGQFVFLNFDFRFGLRSFYIGNLSADPDPSREYDDQTGDSADYVAAYLAGQFHIDLTDARALHYEPGEGLWTDVAPEDFLPNPPFTETGAAGNYTIDVRISKNTFPAGVLLAVVVRGGQTFYLWQT